MENNYILILLIVVAVILILFLKILRKKFDKEKLGFLRKHMISAIPDLQVRNTFSIMFQSKDMLHMYRRTMIYLSDMEKV